MAKLRIAGKTYDGHNYPGETTAGQNFAVTLDSSEPTQILRWERVADFKVEFDVKLASGEHKRLSEREVQASQPTLVYSHWKGLDGRDKTTGYDQFHIFRIINHRVLNNGKISYLVQWVGYCKRESTWEPGSQVVAMSRELKHEYDAINRLV
ncbi:hypothetical protein ACHAPU_011335 [Fusarium lateritium]